MQIIKTNHFIKRYMQRKLNIPENKISIQTIFNFQEDDQLNSFCKYCGESIKKSKHIKITTTYNNAKKAYI